MPLNRAEATSLLMLVSEFNRVKKFIQLKGCERFRCTYGAEPSLPCPVSRQRLNESSSGWQGGALVEKLWLEESRTAGIGVGSRGWNRAEPCTHEPACICCTFNANE